MIGLEHAHNAASFAPSPQLIADSDGACTYANGRWEAYSGLLAESWKGQGWKRAICVEDLSKLDGQWNRLLYRQEDCDIVVRVVHLPTETRRWTRLQACPLRSADGDLFGFVAQFSDVNELWVGQQALEEQKRRLELSGAALYVGHWHIESQSGVPTWSDELHRIHGTDPSTYRPTLEEWIDAFHPEDRAHVTERFRGALEDRRSFGFEAKLLLPNGSLRHVRAAGSPCSNPSDSNVCVVGVCQDISDHRLVADRLAGSEERYGLALKASHYALWDWDIQTDGLWWSERLLEILGVAPEDFRGTFDEFANRLHPDDRAPTMTAVESHLHGHQPYDIEHRLRREPGNYVWVRTKGEAWRDSEGVPVRMVGTINDISSEVHVRMEVQRQTAELEKVNAELEHFASVASHDLREPLRKIRAFCDRVNTRGKIDDEETLNYFAGVRRSTDHLYTMVGELLDISRVAVRSKDRSNVRLGEVFTDVIDNLKSEIELTGATVRIESLPFAFANRSQMSQVASNLIDNAIKYRHPDRSPRIHVRGRETASTVKVEVEDNGIGFDQNCAERIFLLFERLHGEDTPGTGLGLALCRRILEEHEGHIFAEGWRGEGARFTLELPRLLEL